MGQPAAKLGDKVQGTDIHIIMVPSPGGPVPTPMPHPFSGTILSGTSSNVMIEGKPAATMNSIASNLPPHVPLGSGPFAKPPSNQGTVMTGSATVLIGGNAAARASDIVRTCNDPADLPTGSIVCNSTVMIGGPSGAIGSQVGEDAVVTSQQFTMQEPGKGRLTALCVDVDGKPVADCNYELVLPDGRRVRGKTDSDGKITEQSIDPGNCEVHLFP